MLFPIRCLLERLATSFSFADARDQARAFGTSLIEPKIALENGMEWLTIPDDVGYTYTRERAPKIR